MSNLSNPTSDPNPHALTGTTELTRSLSLGRRMFSSGSTFLALLLTGLALLPLLAILYEILSRGLPGLTWATLTSLPAPVGVTDIPNGFANAILGTLTMVGIASLISIPLGIFTAVYLSEFGRKRRTAQIVRFVANILSGVPSIVVGVFAYGVIVLATKTFSAIAGGFALAVIMLPIITLATEEALKLIPTSQRLASAALGANSLQTTFKIVVMAALPGIVTGVLLAVARAAGETAPILFTALFTQNFAQGLFEPTASLPVLIYNYATSAYEEQNKLAWTASAILVGIVLVISFLSRLATRKRKLR